MKKRYIDQLSNHENTPAEEDEIFRKLIQSNLDQSNREKWSVQLGEQGVVRQQPASLRTSWWWAAAAAVLLLMGSVLVWQWVQKETPSAMANQYIIEDEPFPLPSTFRGDDNIGDNRTQALQAYESKDYATALDILGKATAAEAATPPHLFLSGLCRFYAKDYPRAIDLLLQTKQASVQMTAQINWFLALAYHQSGKKDEAETLFREMANDPNSIYSKRAQRMLKQ